MHEGIPLGGQLAEEQARPMTLREQAELNGLVAEFDVATTLLATRETQDRIGRIAIFRGWGHDVPEVQSRVTFNVLKNPKHVNIEIPEISSLYVTTVNVVIDLYRAYSARPRVHPDVELSDPIALDFIHARHAAPDQIQLSMDRDAVQQGLRELTTAQREVLVARFYHGESIENISERLGVPLGTVKSRNHYALQSLKKILAAHSVHD